MVLKTTNKITGQWNVGQSDLKYYEVIHGVKLTYYAKYGVTVIQWTVLMI